MGIGGKEKPFEWQEKYGEESIKGCYAYDYGKYNGLAFFGSKGPIKTMAIKPLFQTTTQEKMGAYPIYKPCLKAGKNILCFLTQVL